MTDHERAFLTAIADEPDADVHRLIYADWLDEQAGEVTPRGEFIRVQVELARPSRCENPRCKNGICFAHDGGDSWDEWDCSCGRAELRRREKELLNAHRRKWFALSGFCEPWSNALDDVVWATGGGPSGNFYFGGKCRRGFISSITLSCNIFLQHAADIIEAVPMLEEVRLTDKEPWLDDEHDPDWSWFDDVLPRPLYSLMLKLARSTRQLKGIHEIDGHWVSFDTPENARIALSVVCLSFARDQLARRHDPKKYARPRSVTYP